MKTQAESVSLKGERESGRRDGRDVSGMRHQTRIGRCFLLEGVDKGVVAEGGVDGDHRKAEAEAGLSHQLPVGAGAGEDGHVAARLDAHVDEAGADALDALVGLLVREPLVLATLLLDKDAAVLLRREREGGGGSRQFSGDALQEQARGSSSGLTFSSLSMASTSRVPKAGQSG